MSEPRTAAGWLDVEPGTPCPFCSAPLHGVPCVHHADDCPELQGETATPALDVERLAQALYSGSVQHVLHSYSYTNREIAAEIAAEYDRLSQPAPSQDS